MWIFLIYIFVRFWHIVLPVSCSVCGYQLGKGWPWGASVCDIFLCFCHFPKSCPESGVDLIVSIPDVWNSNDIPESIFWNSQFWKIKQQMTTKHEHYPACKELKKVFLYCRGCQTFFVGYGVYQTNKVVKKAWFFLLFRWLHHSASH